MQVASHTVTTILLASCVAIVTSTKPGFPPSLKPGCLAADGQPNLFCPGDLGYGCYKIPTLLRTRNGTLLAMIEARKFSCDDQGYVDLRLRRSFDNGKTWGPSILVHGNSSTTEWTTVGDGNMVEDVATGVIWLFHTRNNTRLFISSSSDEGATWSEPMDVTASLKHGFPTQGWIGTGHAGGIQLRNGRLVVPAYSSNSYVIFSDDHGKSWHKGGAIPGKGGEDGVAEMDDGRLIMNFRNSCKLPGCGRMEAYSADGGNTWENVTEVRHLPEPIAGCEGSIVHHPGTKMLYFSHPDPMFRLLRSRLAIWSSSDHGQTWHHHATVWSKAAGYSSMVVMGNSSELQLGLLYERNNHSMLIFEAQSVSFTLVEPNRNSANLLVI